jgi:hypothetical protein
VVCLGVGGGGWMLMYDRKLWGGVVGVVMILVDEER